MITNRIVRLTIDAVGKASAEINIPHKVSEIRVKSIGHTGIATNEIVPNENYGIITSDLFNWNPIGMFSYREATMTTNELRYTLNPPTNIAGLYNFQLYNLDGSLVTGDENNNCVIIFEFICE